MSPHEALNQEGLDKLAAHDLQAALECFSRAIALAPGWAEPYKNIGNCFFRAQDLAQAGHWYRKAIAVDDRHLASWNNLGNVCRYQGDLPAAEQALVRAAELAPDDAEVHANLGAVRLQAGRLGQAEVAFRAALALHPDDLIALQGLGNLAASAGQPEQAIEHYARALALDAQQIEVRRALAHQHELLRDWPQVVALLQPVSAADGESAVLCGHAALAMGEPARAAACAASALALRPQDLHALDLQATVAHTQGDGPAAMRTWAAMLALQPDSAEALSSLVQAKLEACDWEDLERLIGELARLAAAGAVVHPFVALLAGLPADLRLRCVEQTVAARFARLAPLPPATARQPGKIRLGYLSGDFRQHALPELVRLLIESHDRRRFDVVAYSTGPDDGSVDRRSMVAAFEAFHDLEGRSDIEIARRIRVDDIDILVDLSGFTEFGRPGVSALRPARVHVNWLGFIGSMGPLADVIVAAAQTIPPGDEAHYRERVLRLRYYQPNDARRFAGLPRMPGRADCALPARGFVFASFSTSIKLNPALFDAWAAMLRRVPDSVLWLLAYAPAVRENLLRAWQQRGMAAERLVFASRVGLQEHLARLPLADLYLDTLPYSNGTTAADALQMGVPLLSCRGTGYCGRMGASVVTAAGLPELAVDSMADYVDLGVRLATDKAMLDGLRWRLQSARSRRSGPLFEPGEVVADVEQAWVRLMQERGVAPPPAAS